MSTELHSHTHAHHANPDFGGVEANKEWFNKFAPKYEDIPWALQLTAAVSDGIKATHAFDPESSVIMDFACGTGMFLGLHRILFFSFTHKQSKVS